MHFCPPAHLCSSQNRARAPCARSALLPARLCSSREVARAPCTGADLGPGKPSDRLFLFVSCFLRRCVGHREVPISCTKTRKGLLLLDLVGLDTNEVCLQKEASR